MAQYDVYPNPYGTGYLLDVQADILAGLSNRIVAPLLAPENAPKPGARLNPEFEVEGEKLIMTTQFLASVPISILNDPVANLSDYFSEITNALDMLFHGF